MKKAMNKIVDVWNDYPAGVAITIYVVAIIIALGWVFGVMCLQSWVVMLLWNWVAVDLFGAPVLSFWVAFGLRWLCTLLFKGTSISTKNKNE